MARLSTEIINQEVEKLRNMVESGEILKYSERDLEKKVKFTRNTLRRHLAEIKGEIGSRDIKMISLRLVNILDEMMSDIEKYWQRAREQEDEKKIMYYTKQMFFAIEKFTDFLERFGIKEKVADKVNVNQVVLNADVDIDRLSKEILGR